MKLTGLQTFERLSGEPGQPGAKSKLTFLNGKRTIELSDALYDYLLRVSLREPVWRRAYPYDPMVG